MEKKLNTPAIYTKLPTQEIDIKKYNGYPYHLNGKKAVSSVPIYRYAKNFTKSGTDYSIIMATEDSNIEAVEKYLDSIAKKITLSEITEAHKEQSKMKYIDNNYGGTK